MDNKKTALLESKKERAAAAPARSDDDREDALCGIKQAAENISRSLGKHLERIYYCAFRSLEATPDESHRLAIQRALEFQIEDLFDDARDQASCVLQGEAGGIGTFKEQAQVCNYAL